MSTKENNREDFLSPLESIQKVEAPPFLLTSIKQKIKAQQENKISPVFAWSLALSLALIIIMNVAVVAINHKQQAKGLESMEIFNHNSIYP